MWVSLPLWDTDQKHPRTMCPVCAHPGDGWWSSEGTAPVLQRVQGRVALETVTAVTQKSPCEGNRVIMGQESPLKLGQRGPDAREEVPMRTPQQLYAHQRIIYQPALPTCPHCGDRLVMCNYLAW